MSGKVKPSIRSLKLNTLIPKVGRKPELSIEQALAFGIFKQRRGIPTKITVYRQFQAILSRSHKTFVASLNRWSAAAAPILMFILKLNQSPRHPVKHIDSTIIEICGFKNRKHHKTMRGSARLGYPSKARSLGWNETWFQIFRERFNHSCSHRETFQSRRSSVHGKTPQKHEGDRDQASRTPVRNEDVDQEALQSLETLLWTRNTGSPLRNRMPWKPLLRPLCASAFLIQFKRTNEWMISFPQSPVSFQTLVNQRCFLIAWSLRRNEIGKLRRFVIYS